jgi:hypothetical protein
MQFPLLSVCEKLMVVRMSGFFSQRAIEIIASAKIEAAIEAGEFDDLPGFGKPFEFDDTQYDPHWWIRRKVERENMKKLFRSAPTPLTEFASRFTEKQIDGDSRRGSLPQN